MITSSWKAFLSMKQIPKYYELYYQDNPKEKYHFLSSVRECLKHSPGSTKERKFGIKAHYRGLISSDTCALLLLTCLEGWENRFPVSTSSVLLCHFELGLQRTAVVGMKFLGGCQRWRYSVAFRLRSFIFSISHFCPFLSSDWLIARYNDQMPPVRWVSQSKKTAFPPKLSTIKSRHEEKHILKPRQAKDFKKFSPKHPCPVSSTSGVLLNLLSHRVRRDRGETFYTGPTPVLSPTLTQEQNCCTT